MRQITSRSANCSLVYAHAPYVVHAFAKPENALKNNEALKKYINLSSNLELDGFVLHMGGTKWYTDKSVYWATAESLFESLKDYYTPVLLENCASGNDMSGNLTDICELIGDLNSVGYKAGLTLDTCHAWAWGYNYKDTEILSRLITTVKPWLRLIHLNSAPEVVTCGGKYDRHESLDKGVIPLPVFKTLLSMLPGVPTIVERDLYTDIIADQIVVKSADEAP